MIELKHIHKSYLHHGKPVYALKDITLTINKGDIFGILGESGAGKSTLLRTINLLEPPDHGSVIVNQVDLTTLSKSALKQQRQTIGMIFQHFNLLESRTAAENIALPLELLGTPKMAIEHEVTRLLSLVGLSTYRDRYPGQLSGGQKQRVAIARALATKPDIILCDEATSALDPNATAAILDLLKNINATLGVTIVLITHEMDVIKYACHHAAVLDQGYLVETATVLDLFARPQSEVTRRLVQKALHLELPNTIKRRLSTTPSPDKSRLVRLTFVGDDSAAPLISTLIKLFDVTINITQANIETIQEATVGFTICEFSGNATQIDQALAYIQSTSIKAEVIGYV